MTATQHRESIAAELRAQAARQGLRQADIARSVGLTRSAMSRKWRGDSPISVDEFIAIAAALDVPPADLLPATADDESQDVDAA